MIIAVDQLSMADVQALPPTAVIGSVLIPSFVDPNVDCLFVAKLDRVEAWNLGLSGLQKTTELQLWGNVMAVERIDVGVSREMSTSSPTIDKQGSRPHALVLLSPPNAHLLLIAIDPRTSTMIVTSSVPLTPPTPSLRQSEYFSGVIACDSSILVSLWVGVLSCIDVELDKEKDSKRRRSSAVAPAPMDEVEGSMRLRFRDNFNIKCVLHQ